ncbi:AAA family ATPase [Trebonia kvetii]|uniref:AAA family ATPase n=1 Tax=Trebonia kvetii TaxID=2480626 RepID=UPI001FECB4EE|nr:AAA family ATPase [Trebonia kvetii]
MTETGPSQYPAAADAERVSAEVMADMAAPGQRGVIVDSPPGAGKSTLVVRAAAALAGAGQRCIIVAQTNNQVDDLTVRLARPGIALGRLTASDYNVPPALLSLPGVQVSDKIDRLGGAAVILGTAAKWATVTDRSWPWAIIDEAYQMRSDMLLLIADKFERGLFVGDPGQLDPFSIIETQRWTGLPYDPTLNAVSVLQAHNPDLPLHRLPVSWRLPASAAPAISSSFYPFSAFQAGTGPGVRRLEFTASGMRGAVDATLDMAAAAGWALHELPARHTVRTDVEAAAAAAALAARLISRGAVATCEREPGGRPVGPDRMAIGVTHRDQADQVRQALARAAPGIAAQVRVDTANRLQGAEYDVTVVLHPLSGRRDATEFHLEAGRLCVLASRHRHACIVVARAGIAELLDAYPPSEPVRPGVRAKFPDGWEANQSLLTHLSGHKVRA